MEGAAMGNDFPPYVDIYWIADRLSVTPVTLRRWVRSDLMPKPVSLTEKTFRWRLKDLLFWKPGLADSPASN